MNLGNSRHNCCRLHKHISHRCMLKAKVYGVGVHMHALDPTCTVHQEVVHTTYDKITKFLCTNTHTTNKVPLDIPIPMTKSRNFYAQTHLQQPNHLNSF
eukprot:c40525_g1_i1 orf=88-384(+)